MRGFTFALKPENGRKGVCGCMMREGTNDGAVPLILGSPQSNAVPKARIRRFKIVREISVKALVTRLRASSQRLWKAMDRWIHNGGAGDELRSVRKDEASGRYVLTDERVVACWNELCSRAKHLKIRDFGGMPVTLFGERIGGEAHIDLSREDIVCDGSAEALVERMMLKHASNQLYLFWHACYSSELLYNSTEDFLGKGNDMGIFIGTPDFSLRAGYADSGVPVFEFVTQIEYGSDVGFFKWRAMRNDNDPFGVMRGILQKFPLRYEIVCFL